MNILLVSLKIIIAVLSVLLSLLILLHKGKGGGLSAMFDSVASGASSSGVAEKNLNRWTVAIALLWVGLIIAVSLIVKFT
ncbi:preprotein translocase subunit SecG [Bifidobacterium callitrichidarum]|uniref:Protein-export membrane protein SecG n=1 Tax=Bifidobacterium callitrichidarum TaxID=2052941 RepID=A0A2U2N0J6_9BIFI|nr:preprotein translocase subunit SecG [Bifidobacterium callitrichidarum]PWG62650.1 preprotein translocase subunit SecG [Bifidobacterium callitrichidarum]